MSWNASFPTPATRISQSVSQIQNNWAFINTNINVDHYFNVGAPNEGHHQFVNVPNQAMDVAPSLNNILYAKNGSGGNSQLYRNNGVDVRQLAIFTNGSTVIAGAGTSNLINLSGIPNYMGFVLASQNGSSLINACMFSVWDGATSRGTSIVGAGITLGVSGTYVTITTTGPMTVLWDIITLEV